MSEFICSFPLHSLFPIVHPLSPLTYPSFPPLPSTLLTGFLEMDRLRENLLVSSNKPKQAKGTTQLLFT